MELSYDNMETIREWVWKRDYLVELFVYLVASHGLTFTRKFEQYRHRALFMLGSVTFLVFYAHVG
jgi:hypothetical protein